MEKINLGIVAAEFNYDSEAIDLTHPQRVLWPKKAIARITLIIK